MPAATGTAFDSDHSPTESTRNEKTDTDTHCAACTSFAAAITVIRRKLLPCEMAGGCLFRPRDTYPDPPRPTDRNECRRCSDCQALRDAFERGEQTETRCAAGHDWDEVIARSRPCVRASCRYHTLLSVQEDGRIGFAGSAQDIDELHPDWSCALDVADRYPHRVPEIARGLGCTPQAVAAAEDDARMSLASGPHAELLREANRA